MKKLKIELKKLRIHKVVKKLTKVEGGRAEEEELQMP